MKHLIIFFLFGIVGLSKAQPVLEMGQLIPFDLNDTVAENSTESYTVTVINSGNVPFLDTLTLYIGVKDSASVIQVVDSATFINTSIPALDSNSYYLTTTYSIASGYKTGVDIIVVWPYAANIMIGDSLEFEVFITAPLNITEFDLFSYLLIYPNPAKDHVLIDAIENKKIKSIQLIDGKGAYINVELQGTTINVENIPAGIYILDIELENNQRRYGKFIKQ